MPLVMDSSLLSRVTEVTGVVTKILQEASFSPALAVIVASPSPTAVTTPSFTVATFSSLEDQVTVGSVASSGRTVAVRVAVLPLMMGSSVLSKAIEVTGVLTVTLQVASFSPALAVIVASPSAMAVITPPLTVAIFSSLEDHVTVGSVASSGRTVTVRVAVLPLIIGSSVLSRVIEVTGVPTVTLHLASFSPALAVMVVSPSAMAVIIPSLTVATFSLLEDQVIFGSVASSGSTVAVRINFVPLTMVSSVFVVSRVIEVTGVVTVILLFASFSPAFAVIVASPSPTAVTTPSLTVATFSSLEDQVTVGSVASSGRTVALRVALLPLIMGNSVLSKAIEVTGVLTVTLHVASFSPAFAVIVASPSPTAVTVPSLTVATFSLLEDQVIFGSVASSGKTVALRVAVLPLIMYSSLLSRETEVTGVVTVILHLASFSPALAVMVASPSAIAVITPSLTVATFSSLEDHVTVGSVASSGSTLAVRVAVLPLMTGNSVLSKAIEVTGVVTVILHLASFSPAFAVMMASPSATAVTTPSFTVATFSLPENHVTVGSVASPGSTVAVRVFFSPVLMASSVLSKVTDVTGVVTVTLQLASFPTASAVMIASPSATAVTEPSLTTATFSLLEDHVTVLSVASSGRTVAVRVMVLPLSIASSA